METLRSEHAQADTAHAAEYEKLKQEKENDIAKLKGILFVLCGQMSLETCFMLCLNVRKRFL